jgi:regulator of sigma E protease
VLTVDRKPVDNFNKVPMELLLSDTRSIEVQRDGQVISIPVNTATLAKIIKRPSDLLSPRFPFEVAELLPDGAGKKAGIIPGDLFVSVNNTPTPFFHDVRNALQQNKGKQVPISVLRKGVPTLLTVQVPETGKLGLAPAPVEKYMPITIKKYGFFEAIPAGTKKAFTTLSDYLRQFKLIFNSEVKGYESVGGFITFGKVFSPEWDWLRFWNLTAFFSIVLAIMNVLPIPALDGGHVLFLLYEMITRRKPHEKVLEYAQLVGMILVFGLVIYANANDVVRLFAR